ncbi:hypothetical protein L7F22_034162 [Adiantum nelumboides]|nr:hypothetical protein [Adiantum nelumboides]
MLIRDANSGAAYRHKAGSQGTKRAHSLEQCDVLNSIVTNAALTVKLGKKITKALGFSSLDSECFEREVIKLKLEKNRAKVRRHGVAHALYVQQFIVLLVAISLAAILALCLPSSTRESNKCVVTHNLAVVQELRERYDDVAIAVFYLPYHQRCDERSHANCVKPNL